MLFFAVNGLATVINAAPLWIARYLLDLRVPEVSRLVQEACEFASGIVLGTLLAMVFLLWAYRRWVFLAVRPVTGADGDHDPAKDFGRGRRAATGRRWSRPRRRGEAAVNENGQRDHRWSTPPADQPAP